MKTILLVYFIVNIFGTSLSIDRHLLKRNSNVRKGEALFFISVTIIGLLFWSLIVIVTGALALISKLKR